MVTSTRDRTHARSNSRSTAMRSFRKHTTAMKDDARHLAESAGAVAREQIDPLRGLVMDKPFQSVLIAAGVGMFLGLLFGRR